MPPTPAIPPPAALSCGWPTSRRVWSTGSASSSHQSPAAPRAARAKDVRARAASAGNAPASPARPSAGARSGADHAAGVAGSVNGATTRAHAHTSAIPPRPAAASQTTRAVAAASQPSRGRSATAIPVAIAPAAGPGPPAGAMRQSSNAARAPAPTAATTRVPAVKPGDGTTHDQGLERCRDDAAGHVVDLVEAAGEGGAQVLHRSALVWERRHRDVDRAAQRGGEVAPHTTQGGQALRAVALGQASAAQRVHAAEGLVEHHGEAVEVRRGADAPAGRLLRRHVRQRPHHVARVCERVVADEVGDAEVGELRGRGRAVVVVRVGDHDVRRLEVAVDDPARVCVRERVAKREADRDHVTVRQGALVLQVGERAPADELRDEVERALVRLRLVDRDDRRVAEPRGGARFASHPGREAARRRGEALGCLDALDGDLAVETLVVREPHDPESARAERFDQPVALEDEGPCRPAAARAQAPRRGGRVVVRAQRDVVGGLHRLRLRRPAPPSCRACPY